VNNSLSVLLSYEDAKFQRFWGHDLDRLGSCDVIGHVTNGLAVVTFYWWSMMTMHLSCIVMEI